MVSMSNEIEHMHPSMALSLAVPLRLSLSHYQARHLLHDKMIPSGDCIPSENGKILFIHSSFMLYTYLNDDGEEYQYRHCCFVLRLLHCASHDGLHEMRWVRVIMRAHMHRRVNSSDSVCLKVSLPFILHMSCTLLPNIIETVIGGDAR